MELNKLGGIVGAPFNVLGPPRHYHPPFMPVHPPIPAMPPPPPNNTNITVNVNGAGGNNENQTIIDNDQNTRITLISNRLENLSSEYYSIISGNYDRSDIEELFNKFANLTSSYIELSNSYNELAQQVQNNYDQLLVHLLPQDDNEDDYQSLIDNLGSFNDDIHTIVG